MLARLLHDLTKGRIRLPLWTGSSANAGDLRLDGKVPRLTANDTPKTDMRLLTDQDLGQPNGPAMLDASGMLPAAVIPPTTSSGGSSGADLLGEIKMWAGSPLRTPSGWLVCDGSEIYIDANPQLFNVIGHLYGRSSNPSLRFKLPNLVARSPVGCVGINDASSGKLHKVIVRSRGSGFIPNHTYAPISLVPDGATIIGSPATVTLVTGADGGVDRVDVTLPGEIAGIVSTANPTSDASNCSLRIPVPFGVSGFTYDIYLAPTDTVRLGWGVKVTDRGSGYGSAPAVTISGGSVIGATAVAVMDGSDISAVIITNPGTGDPTGATVSFSGGSPVTPAAASIVFFPRPVVPGDTAGEQTHTQLTSELVAHTHVYWQEAGSPGEPIGGDFSGGGDRATSSTGGSRPAASQSPYMGVLFLIRAN